MYIVGSIGPNRRGEMGIQWRKKPRPYMDPASITLTKTHGDGDYWSCSKTGKLYERRGDDFIHVKTQTLEEWMKEPKP